MRGISWVTHLEETLVRDEVRDLDQQQLCKEFIEDS